MFLIVRVEYGQEWDHALRQNCRSSSHTLRRLARNARTWVLGEFYPPRTPQAEGRRSVEGGGGGRCTRGRLGGDIGKGGSFVLDTSQHTTPITTHVSTRCVSQPNVGLTSLFLSSLSALNKSHTYTHTHTHAHIHGVVCVYLPDMFEKRNFPTTIFS